LQREIFEFKTGTNDTYVSFHNGSWIKVVASNDNARSARANMVIADEFRMIDLSIINKVLRKFLTAPRQPNYLNKPEYKHLTERNKEIYISSAWYKSHWSWDKFLAYKEAMLEGKKYFVCGLPYQLSIAENLLMKEQVLDEMQEKDFDSISWSMEMDCLFFGQNENAYFKFEDVTKCRVLKKPFIPTLNIDYDKKKKVKDERRNGEKRVIGVDLALMGGNVNDNTIFTCIRLIPTPSGEEYEKQVVYIESLNGQHSTKQAIRLKQLYEDFKADYVVMDTYGNGISIFDDCVKVLYDEERDVEYEAWTCFNNEDMAERSTSENALPIIFSIKAGAEINHKIATYLRNDFQKGRIKLLVNELEGMEHLINNKDYIRKSEEEKANMEFPYLQTTSLVNELVNLEYTINDGKVKIKETSGARKDRYSSLGYANYYIKILENELTGGSKKNNDWSKFMFKN